MLAHILLATALWPLLVYGIAVVLLAAGMLTATHYLGERREVGPETHDVFESGVAPTGSARLLFPIHFYVIAMFFVIFDLEAVFVYSWAISIREAGWAGYLGVFTFIVDLTVVLVYVWRIGALDFGPSGKKILKAYHKKIKQRNNEVVDN